MVSRCGFVSLIKNDVERVFMCLVVICVFFLSSYFLFCIFVLKFGCLIY